MAEVSSRKDQSLRPFLKWAGGKTQLLGEIEKKVIPFLEARAPIIYVEPFIGSGAVFFFLLKNYRQRIKQAIISDINADLINLYQVIRDQPRALIVELANLEKQYFTYATEAERKIFFLESRAAFNALEHMPLQKSALLLFLNKTCFNGLYRVNSKGKFNVPFGKYQHPTICNTAVILADSEALQGVEILHADFEETRPYINQHTFIYLDPPYKPISSTSSFNTYAKEGFEDADQIRLKKFCDEINAQGAYFVLSNSDTTAGPEHNFFQSLYSEYTINRVKAKRAINSNGKARGEISELLIANDNVLKEFIPVK